MPEEPEEGFVVRDRRRYMSEDAEAEAPAPAKAPPASPPTAPSNPVDPGFAPPTASPASASGGRSSASGSSTSGFGSAAAGPGFASAPASAFGTTGPQNGGFQTGGFGSEGNLPPDTNASGYGEEFDDADELNDLTDIDALEAGEASGGPQEIPDVYSMLLVFLEQLRGLAYLYMGLINHPAAQQVGVDLEQAKVAINTIGFVVSQLEPVVAPEERLPLKALVSDLQVAFVEQAKRQNGSTGQPGPENRGGFPPRRRA